MSEANKLIQRGLLQRQRKKALAEGDADQVAAIDKRLVAPTAVEAAQEDQIRSLIGDGFDDLDGPEMTELRGLMEAAPELADKAASPEQMISNGLKKRRGARSRPDESFIPDWANQGGIRRG